MKCPSCNDVIPDNSQFCVNCGSVLESLVSHKTESLNTRTPVQISNISIRVDNHERGKTNWLSGKQSLILHNLIVNFQLLDDKNLTTASEGVFSFKIEFWQSKKVSTGFGESYDAYVTRNFLNFDKKTGISLSDFYRAKNDKGNIWCKYKYPHSVEINIKPELLVMAQIELWFTPSGSKQKLCKKDFSSIDQILKIGIYA